MEKIEILTSEKVRKAILEGQYDFARATIKGSLDLNGATIEGNLYLIGATIEGSLYLNEATIKGSLDLSIKEGPKSIYVSPEMAQLVHWAAPTVPLVVIKQ